VGWERRRVGGERSKFPLGVSRNPRVRIGRSEAFLVAGNRKALFGPVGRRLNRAFLAFRVGVLKMRGKGNRRMGRYEGHGPDFYHRGLRGHGEMLFF